MPEKLIIRRKTPRNAMAMPTASRRNHDAKSGAQTEQDRSRATYLAACGLMNDDPRGKSSNSHEPTRDSCCHHDRKGDGL